MKSRAELFTELTKFFHQDAAALITKYEQENLKMTNWLY